MTALTNMAAILSTLTRHRIAAGLIVMEVALALAFVSNALHMIAVRVDRLTANTGLPEHELVNIDLRAVARIEQSDAMTQEDLRRLRAVPGVKGAAVTNQVIYGNNSVNSGVSNSADRKSARVGASSYAGDEHFVPVHGLKLIAGRNFLPDEVIAMSVLLKDPDTPVPVLIVNRALAEALYPGQSAIGKPVWVMNGPSTIVGLVEALPHTNPRQNPSRYAFIGPLRENFRDGTYVLRVEPGRQQAVLKEAAAVLRDVDPRRSIGRGKTLSEMRADYDAEDRAMTFLLVGVCAALLAVTAFGIVGLASFWVAQRTRMIGIRRALGATQAQIRGYFQLENLLLCGAGVLLGAAGAFALSQFVVQAEGGTALPWFYVPVGALLLLALGQLAVLAPARRASNVPAASAMRS